MVSISVSSLADRDSVVSLLFWCLFCVSSWLIELVSYSSFYRVVCFKFLWVGCTSQCGQLCFGV